MRNILLDGMSKVMREFVQIDQEALKGFTGDEFKANLDLYNEFQKLVEQARETKRKLKGI